MSADKTLREFGKTRIVPKTGQTIEYQAGDDGTYEAGNPASPRFVDNGDGTISDKATGFMWIKQPELIIPGVSVRTDNQIQVAHSTWETSHAYIIADLIYDNVGMKYYVCAVAHTSGNVDFATDLAAHPTYWRETIWTSTAEDLTHPASMNWSNSIINCEALVYAGFSNWRLPNIKELMSIVDYGLVSPSINAIYFPNTQSNWYWSGTMYATNLPTENPMLINFADSVVYWGDPSNLYYARPVRGGI